MAAQRRTEAHKLIQSVKGDLDWIAMKAMEKDRSRRYETANGLALDIQRQLRNEPVSAGPPGSVTVSAKCCGATGLRSSPADWRCWPTALLDEGHAE